MDKELDDKAALSDSIVRSSDVQEAAAAVTSFESIMPDEVPILNRE